MKILLVKTSSLGDIIHSFPALTDAKKAYPDFQCDWVVETSFASVAAWHPTVQRTIPIALRTWRKQILQKETWLAFKHFIAELRLDSYDLILDAQGLLKSAWIAPLAHGPSAGLDWHSARESLASLFYRHRYRVDFNQHAITRTRQLFAQALHYDLPSTEPTGLDATRFSTPETTQSPYLLFLHGTTWENKKWPLDYWKTLAQQANAAGQTVYIPWSNEEEKHCAEAMQQRLQHIHVLPKQSLTQMAQWIAHAKAIVAVDTGLGHLAAALGTPTLSLYGPTNPARTGTLGPHQAHLATQFSCAPCLKKVCAYQGEIKSFPACFTRIPPELVWEKLNGLTRR